MPLVLLVASLLPQVASASSPTDTLSPTLTPTASPAITDTFTPTTPATLTLSATPSASATAAMTATATLPANLSICLAFPACTPQAFFFNGWTAYGVAVSSNLTPVSFVWRDSGATIRSTSTPAPIAASTPSVHSYLIPGAGPAGMWTLSLEDAAGTPFASVPFTVLLVTPTATTTASQTSTASRTSTETRSPSFTQAFSVTATVTIPPALTPTVDLRVCGYVDGRLCVPQPGGFRQGTILVAAAQDAGAGNLQFVWTDSAGTVQRATTPIAVNAGTPVADTFPLPGNSTLGIWTVALVPAFTPTALAAVSIRIIESPPGFDLSDANLLGARGVNPIVQHFVLPAAGRARIDLFSRRGAKIATLLDQTLPAGRWVVDWSGRLPAEHAAPGGVYEVRLTAPQIRDKRKWIVQW